jgi:uncharacterized protein
MLIEFSASNFRSILGRQTLSMVASPDTTHSQRNVSLGKGKDLSLLKSAVIYGPNAAGKSNLLRAVGTLQQLVQTSATGIQEGQRIPVTPFIFSKLSAEQPSEFEIIFIADDGNRYHYCCVVSPERVFKEWLVAYPSEHGRAQRWFEREYDATTKSQQWWFGPNFKAERAERKVWQEFTRDNALFLSTAIQLNNAQLKPVFSWITQKLIVLVANVRINPGLSLELLRQDKGREDIMRFMRAADLGIDRLELREEDLLPQPLAGPLPPGAMRVHFEVGLAPSAPPAAKQLRVLAWHKTTDSDNEVPLDMGDESDGTQKLFEFTGGWLHALKEGATLFVDELDRSLHPHMARFLVGLFHGHNNEKSSQLIFTTHDTTLLDTDLLRRDQIWFVEKDQQNSSHFYSLLEYSPRKDEALERGYLKGRYGAIPFIGNLEV